MSQAKSFGSPASRILDTVNPDRAAINLAVIEASDRAGAGGDARVATPLSTLLKACTRTHTKPIFILIITYRLK